MPHESQYVQYYRGREVRRVVNRMEHVRVPSMVRVRERDCIPAIRLLSFLSSCFPR